MIPSSYLFHNWFGDITAWRPHSRIQQIEYAMGAAKPTSATTALKLKKKKDVVLISLKKNQSKLSACQNGILHIDNYMVS